jgi:hypothetical protein
VSTYERSLGGKKTLRCVTVLSQSRKLCLLWLSVLANGVMTQKHLTPVSIEVRSLEPSVSLSDATIFAD